MTRKTPSSLSFMRQPKFPPNQSWMDYQTKTENGLSHDEPLAIVPACNLDIP